MLYLCMSAAGSIPVLVCFLLWILQKQSYHARLGKTLLLIGMFFYLVPFQMIKFVLPPQVVSTLSLKENDGIEESLQRFVTVRSMSSPDESVWIPDWLIAVLLIWLCCILVFSLYQIIKYRLDVKKLLAQSEIISVEIDGKTVELLVNKKIRTPYTVGFIKQSILIPEGSTEHSCFPMFYRHEEQHRRNHDSLMKLICILIICVHWLNPIAILLLFLYSVTAEYLCDAKATEGCTDDEKKRYLQLLISLSSIDEPLSVVWKNNLSGSEKLMKRRINYMMKNKKTGRIKKGIAAAVSAITVFASASTILAYNPLWSTNESSVEALEGGSFGAFSDIDDMILDFSHSDVVFIYEDGTQIAITEDVSPNALCIHNMVDGFYSVHKPDSSGGCIIYKYYARRCTKCGYTELGDLYSTITYVVCPH